MRELLPPARRKAAREALYWLLMSVHLAGGSFADMKIEVWFFNLSSCRCMSPMICLRGVCLRADYLRAVQYFSRRRNFDMLAGG